MKENDIPGAEHWNENDLEDTERNKSSAIPNFMPQILPNDKIVKWWNLYYQMINSLNSMQKEPSQRN